MPDSGLPLCSKAASLGGALCRQQDFSLTPSREAAQHGVAQHSMQPGHMHDAVFAGSQSEDSYSTTGYTIIPVNIPSSGNAAPLCKIGSELSGRRAKQKNPDLCSVVVEDQVRETAHERAHLEWAQRTGYCAGEEASSKRGSYWHAYCPGSS